MICEIQPPNPNIANAVDYNERKMSGRDVRDHERDASLGDIEDGYVLATRNVPEGTTLLEEFHRLKLVGLKSGKRGPNTKNTTFHMSVNPSATDRPLSDREAVELIDEIMAGMGYANQPYRIYKHTDIARMHYHVVSTRAGQDGRKINDSYERTRLRTVLEPLREKYGFTLVSWTGEENAKIEASREKTATGSDEHKQSRENRRKEAKTESAARSSSEKPAAVPPFSRKSPLPVTEQMKNAIEDAGRWSYSTFEQVQALMLRRYRIIMELQRAGDKEDIILYGADADGSPCTPPVNAETVKEGLRLSIIDKCRNAKMSSRKRQNERINELTKAVAATSDSWEEFVATMERKGVFVVLSWNRNDEAFGVTYLDRATRCAWKGSETAVGIDFLKAKAKAKGWTISRDKFQEKAEKRNAQPSRRADFTGIGKQTETTAAPSSPAGNEKSPTNVIKDVIKNLAGIRGAHHNMHADGKGKGRTSFEPDEYEENEKKGPKKEI